MESKYPIQELNNLDDHWEEEQHMPEESGGRRVVKRVALVTLVLLLGVAAVLAALFFAPTSWWEQVGLQNPLQAEEEMTSILVIPKVIAVEPDNSAAYIVVSQQTPDDFLTDSGAQPLPDGLAFASNVYRVALEEATSGGEVFVTIPANTAVDTIDLYGWNGTSWYFLPHRLDIEQQQMVAVVETLPQVVALMQVRAPETPLVDAEVAPEDGLAAELLPHINRLSVPALQLLANGTFQQEETAVPTGPYLQLLQVTNTDKSGNPVPLKTILEDSVARQEHIEHLVTAAEIGQYNGINLDYQSVPIKQAEQFTRLVEQLAAALHEQELQLALTLAAPQPTDGLWNSGGQDWAALGQAADAIYVHMPLKPDAYVSKGEAEQLLAWAVRQVERHKLLPIFSTNALIQSDSSLVEVANEQALIGFGELQLVQGSEQVDPRTQIEVALSGDVDPLSWNEAGGMYQFSYRAEDGSQHQVWLSNEAAIAQRLQLASRYHLGGIALRGFTQLAADPGYVTVVTSFLGMAEAPTPPAAAIRWLITDQQGTMLANAANNELSITWESMSTPGSYLIESAFVQGQQVVPLGTVTITVDALEVENTVADAADPALELISREPNAVINKDANVREGPALTYSTVTAVASAGTEVLVTARSVDADWLHIELPDTQQGWIFAPLLTLDSGVLLSSFPVSEETVSQIPNATVTVDANIRRGPGIGFETLGTLPQGTQIRVKGRDVSSTWLQTTYEGSNGWIFTGHVLLTDPDLLLDLPTAFADNDRQPPEEPVSEPEETTETDDSGCRLPDIVTFFASEATDEISSFALNWEVTGADFVEMWGQRYPHKHKQNFVATEPGYWILWAKVNGTPDDCFAEEILFVDPDDY